MQKPATRSNNLVSLPVAKQAPAISVIMVSYMTGPALLESVRAVLSDPDINELILIDNGNPPAMRKRLFQIALRRVGNSSRLRLYQGHGNIGFAKACNYGAKMARGDYLLFLNPDAILETGSARRMSETGNRLQAPWLVGGQLLTSDGLEQRGGRRGALTFASAFASFTPLHSVFGIGTIHWEHQPKPTNAIEVPTISGACVMANRASFDMLGGFNEGYFLHVEDIEICRRVRNMGGTVQYEPGAIAMHYGSTSDVPRWRVEWHKLRGFLRYFWTSGGLVAKLGTIVGAPLMAFAILGRAAYLTVRHGITGH